VTHIDWQYRPLRGREELRRVDRIEVPSLHSFSKENIIDCYNTTVREKRVEKNKVGGDAEGREMSTGGKWRKDGRFSDGLPHWSECNPSTAGDKRRKKNHPRESRVETGRGLGGNRPSSLRKFWRWSEGLVGSREKKGESHSPAKVKY